VGWKQHLQRQELRSKLSQPAISEIPPSEIPAAKAAGIGAIFTFLVEE
jgi:hypothetical protein